MTREEWEEWKSKNRNDWGALKDLANDEGHEELFDDLIANDDDLDEFVRNRLESGGWQGVACCISDIINNMSDDYYEIDGYGNLTTCSSWDSYAEELERELDFDELTCDECGESADAVYGLEEWCEELDLSDDFRDKLVKFVHGSTNWSLYYDYCEVCFNKVKAIVEKWDGEMDSDEFEESLENEEDSDEE
jgi:hypothetical protein